MSIKAEPSKSGAPTGTKRAAKKPFGLQFYWVSLIGKREVHMTSWYPSEDSRDKAITKALKDAERGTRIKFTKIVKVQR